MTAKSVVNLLLEAQPVDPYDLDDPTTFLANYRDAFERIGFTLSTTDEGKSEWVWRDGIYAVEVVKIDPLPGEHGGGGYAVWGFINVQEDDMLRGNAYAHKVVRNEAQAAKLAAQYQKELPKSLAARLIKLGFTGWRAHWHKSSLHATLKPKYVNINLDLRYVPNKRAIRVLTALSKFMDRELPMD